MPRKNLDRLLLLIDGSNLAHRAYSKFLNLKDYKDISCGMLYGFLKLLYSYILRFKPKYVVITFDTKQSKKSNYRNQLLGSYKIHREDLKMDYEDYNRQLKEVIYTLKYLNIPLVYDLQGLGHEADDYIGYISMLHSKWHSKVIIVSSDKDFCQLINKDVTVFNPFKSERISINNCKNIMGYSPEECVDYLCLVGDKSDDIPGYKGIGVVKARMFLDQFGSIRNFLKSDSEFKGIDRDGLKDLYKRNKLLIDIRLALKKYPIKDIPIIYDVEDRYANEHPIKNIPSKYRVFEGISIRKVKEVLDSHQFRSLNNREFFDTFSNLKQWRPKD